MFALCSVIGQALTPAGKGSHCRGSSRCFIPLMSSNTYAREHEATKGSRIGAPTASIAAPPCRSLLDAPIGQSQTARN